MTSLHSGVGAGLASVTAEDYTYTKQEKKCTAAKKVLQQRYGENHVKRVSGRAVRDSFLRRLARQVAGRNEAGCAGTDADRELCPG